MRYNLYVDGDFSTIVTFDGEVTHALVEDKSADLYAWGHSKQHPDDDYSREFGETLATARAMSRYFKKLEKALIRTTK